MKKKEIQEMQRVLLEDLKVFDSICDNNNIDYFLSSGSLLGAVRHKGFIPWDDDLDIMLTRDNYNKLLSICDQFPSRYMLLNYSNDIGVPIIYSHLVDTYYKCYKEYTGTNRDFLHIDIYACDYIKNNRFTKGQLAKWIELILNRVYSYRKGHTSFDSHLLFVKKNIIRFFNRIFVNWKDEDLIRLVIRLVGSSHDEGLMAPIASPYGYQKEMFPSSYYKELIKVDFENTLIPISKHYDAILKQLYGDYMELPPENVRYKEIEMYRFEKCESEYN